MPADTHLSLVRRPRGRRLLIGATLVMLTIWTGFRIWTRLQLAGEIAPIQVARLPLTPMELDRWYPQVPVADNRASVILQAGVRYLPEKNSPLSGNYIMPKPGEVYSPEQIDLIRRLVETNKVSIEMLHRAAALGSSRYPINLGSGMMTMLPHLAWVKGNARLLGIVALHHALKDEPEAALQAVKSLHRLTQSLSEEPLYISQLVRFASETLMIDAIESIVNVRQFSDEILAELSQICIETEIENGSSLYRAFVGERATMLEIFDYTHKQTVAAGLFGPSANGIAGSIGFSLWSISGLREYDKVIYLRTMEAFISASTNSYPARWSVSSDAEKQAERRFSTGLGRFAVFSRMGIPGLLSGTKKDALLIARLRCARAALAMERWQLARGGELPASLEELVPEYLPQVPVDPINAQPLEYQQDSQAGFTLVSRGATDERNRGATGNAVKDVGFVVKRPKSRAPS